MYFKLLFSRYILMLCVVIVLRDVFMFLFNCVNWLWDKFSCDKCFMWLIFILKLLSELKFKFNCEILELCWNICFGRWVILFNDRFRFVSCFWDWKKLLFLLFLNICDNVLLERFKIFNLMKGIKKDLVINL